MTLKPPGSPNTPLGTGRVVFNAQADYGARGDNVADDRVALQAAIQAASAVKGNVFLSPGTYLTSGPLTIPDGVRVIGANPANTIIEAKSNFTGAAVIMNATNDGTQEYAWIENLFIHGAGVAPSCIIFDRVFVPSGIRNVTAMFAAADGIVIKSNGAQTAGPIYVENVWCSNHANNCFVVGDLMENVIVTNLTAEHPGNGFAGLKIAGVSTQTVLVNGFHTENYNAGRVCVGVLIDGAQNVHVRGVSALGYAAGAYSDVVKIQNTVGGFPLGITIEKIKSAVGTNYVNDTVNSRTFAMDANQSFESYQTEALQLDKMIAPSLSSDWANLGGGYRPAAYYKDAAGNVHIEGVVRTPGGKASGSIIFVLPAGYRPSTTVIVGGWRTDTGVAIELSIASDGGVRLGTTVGATGVITLNVPPFIPA